MLKKIVRRPCPKEISSALEEVHPVLQRVLAARGVQQSTDIDHTLAQLLPVQDLKGIDQAVSLLWEALSQQWQVVIVGDFDADGATSTALALLIMHQFGFDRVNYLVPNRFKHGYGLSPEIVAEAQQRWQPQLIMTVDNGIANHAGVIAANELGIKVLITDHHLPGDSLPPAAAIVNPNQPGCAFKSKNLAGVGVVFYLMAGLRARLRQLDYFKPQSQSQTPNDNIAQWLDIVALGTVADVVPLDKNNRVLVQQGLLRIRNDACRPGIKAMLQLAKRSLSRVVAADLGFAVGPRLNAAGRLDDMSLGIECLLADSLDQAKPMAMELDALNHARREVERTMQQEALTIMQQWRERADLPLGLCVFQPQWHLGVVGILAGRLKDRFHRPVIAFAQENDDYIKGSARSIPGIHIRDVLATIDARYPGLITKFGGHAMAAGLNLPQVQFSRFAEVFNQIIAEEADLDILQGKFLSDGTLQPQEMTLAVAELLKHSMPWGQQFPEPTFDGCFSVLQQRILGGQHLKLRLELPSQLQAVDAMVFNADLEHWPTAQPPNRVRLVYRLDVNHFRGSKMLQLLVDYCEPVS